ncbi:glycoside hydrolase family 18 protein [Cohnella cellulosilytica]
MRKLIGYVGTRDLSAMREQDVRSLDVINIAFAGLQDGRVIWSGEGSREALRRIRRIHPGIKLMLSVGGWGADGFSQAAATQAGRERLAASAVELIGEYGLDGVDIDWEYPGSSLAGISASREDKRNFTLLLRQLREAIDTGGPGRMLTIAAGGDTYFTLQTDMREICRYLDYVMLMTYDLQGGFQTVTGHHAALYQGSRNLIDACVDKAVRVFGEAGVPAEKMIIGVPFYSRQWDGVKGGGDGLGQEAATVGHYGPDYGSLADYVELTDRAQQGAYRRYWDPEAGVPYLFDGGTFISYEDQQSLAGKIAYIRERGLAGIMFWEYRSDPTGTLIPFLREQMDK